MKQIFILLLAVFLISSCSIQQDLYFNKDGSGNLRMTMDANKLLELGKMTGQLGGKSDSTKTSKQKMQEMVLNNLDKMYLDFKIDFYDFLPDSIKETVENPEDLKGYSFVVYNNKSNFEIGIDVSFKSLEDLDNKASKMSVLLDEFTKTQKNSGNEKLRGLDMFTKGSSGLINSDYSKYIKFKKGKIILLPQVNDAKEKSEEGEADAMIESMIQARTFIHLPGKAKKSKNDDYSIQDKYKVELKNSGPEAFNSGDKPIIIKYKRAWWDIF